ncbi:hypothetical protein GIB67_015752 [Kingdonia uniflora]|uniref:Uncharacterized protein n=1 Tax=Kingdonia uniflora TaxID=39325 RepID=A0A7J7NUR4_9MAGN|nr:hypothetical protein GIB67_015752 [Kingdonia uniflora]
MSGLDKENVKMSAEENTVIIKGEGEKEWEEDKSILPGLRKDANVALNKEYIYISKTSPPGVSKAYLSQFQKDFSLILRSRSEEIAYGGQMVLTLRGRRAINLAAYESCLFWDLLAQGI